MSVVELLYPGLPIKTETLNVGEEVGHEDI